MEFISVKEEEIQKGSYLPLNVVFCIIYNDNGYLLVQNSESGYWELPVQQIVKDESLRDCANHICKDITNQDIGNLELVGLCEITFENRLKSEYFAIYSTKLHNWEIADKINDIRWYKNRGDLEPVCRTSSNIIQYFETISNL